MREPHMPSDNFNHEMICKYFGICGGCSLQNLSYSEQLKMKGEFLLSLFDFEIKVEPSVPFHYRNRMDFVYAFRKLGLRKRGDWRVVVDIDECLIASKRINKELKRVKEFLRENEVESYDFIRHRGYLRYVVMRHGFFTDDFLTIFVVAEPRTFEYDGKHVFSLNDTMSDVSYGRIIGEPVFLTEKFEGITYFIHPNVFFQTNSHMALRMFKEVKKFVHGKVLDLFAGMGAISFFVADACDEVKAVEINEDALISAKKTAEYNGITNVEFIVGDARKVKPEADVVILDPPRQGCGKKLMQKLADVKRIIYLSCNPKTQAQDISYLDHEIIYARAFDCFPQTPHVENLVVLEK